VPFNCMTPLPILVKLPSPVTAPETCVVFAATLNSLFAPVKAMSFESVIALFVFNSATLLDALLSKLMPALVLVKLLIALKSNTAVSEASGVIKMLPPDDEPNAPATVAASVPSLIVVSPV